MTAHYLILIDGVPVGDAIFSIEILPYDSLNPPPLTARVIKQTESRTTAVTQSEPEADEAPHWLFREHFNGDGEVL